jgi:vitamin B12/bleomycin/antimicrobial peptide transport system ATP-binding/permease protein
MKQQPKKKFDWQIIRQFLTLAHEYWYPVSKRSPLIFLGLIVLIILFIVALFYFFVYGATKGAHLLNPEFAAKTAPGLLQWIRGIGSSWMGWFFPVCFIVPLTVFVLLRDKFKGRMRPWIYLFILLALSFSVSGLNVVISYVARYFQTALAGKKEAEYWHFLYVYGSVFIVGTPIVVLYAYTRKRLALFWRWNMTERFLERYSANRAYYHINSDKEVDNPDQRMTEDIKYFTNTSLSFLLAILNSIIDLIAFTGILWLISRKLSYILIAYATIGTVITLLFGRRLIGLNFGQLKKEADLRYGLVHVRNNAEAIAFYQGEEKEKTGVKRLLGEAMKNFNLLIGWQRNLDYFTTAYDYLIVILPALIIAPLYFAGQKEFGEIAQAGFAFRMVLGAVSIIISQFESITAFAAGIKRVAVFDDHIAHIEKTMADSSAPRIAAHAGSALSVNSLRLATPDGARTLLKDLNFTLGQDDRLLIAGPSGVGKTSLLRAIAGIWERGEGGITRPPLENTLFLPQKPYMILGNLREQLQYPRAAGLADAELTALMEKVQLGPLAAKMREASGGANIFDRIEKWDDFLSLGEQQRLAFARVFATRPSFVILDEATSALDAENEKILYRLLSEQGMPYVSVGHRPNLAHFHNRVLLLSENGWEIVAPDEYLKRMNLVYSADA